MFQHSMRADEIEEDTSNWYRFVVPSDGIYYFCTEYTEDEVDTKGELFYEIVPDGSTVGRIKEGEPMNDWKVMDIGVLLSNSLDIKRNKSTLKVFSFFCLFCIAVILVGMLAMPTDDGKAYMGFILFVYVLLCSPMLIYGFYKAFVFDRDPKAYICAEVTLDEGRDRGISTKFFTVRFADENGTEIVADTDAVFSTNGLARLQYDDYFGKQAKIAYHKENKKVYILEIL